MNLSGRKRNPALFLYRLLWNSLDWLFPPDCAGCGSPGFRWCQPCQEGIQQFGSDVCPLCGFPGYGGKLCPTCRVNPPHFSALRSYGRYFGALRLAIHALKYKKDIAIAETLSLHLIEIYKEQAWHIDFVTAVPLNRDRFNQRGYNQSALLAYPLALFIRKPYLRMALERTRNTPPQVGLNAAQRRLNVQGAFCADAGRVRGKTALIVDDVTTTGATISACSEALLDAGAKAVYGLTLARAARMADSDDRLDGEPDLP